MIKNIVIIDDDIAVRNSFELVLEEMDYQVRLAEDGLTGIALARETRPDLIFLDLKMPGIDGVETMRRLLAMDPSLKIYIVTAFSEEYLADLKLAQDEGLIFELASKPLSATQIRHITRSVCSNNKIGQETKSANGRITLTLYVMSINPEVKQCIAELNDVLAQTYEPGCWALNVVEVLSMPEKALQNDVFATPMLVRDVPAPILKLLGDLSKMSNILLSIADINDDRSDTVMM